MGAPAFWNSLVLAMPMDGANGSTTAVDLKGRHGFTAAGNAQISTVAGGYGGASALFDGSGDWFETADNLGDFCFGLGDFTIEFRVNTTATGKVLLDFYSATVGWSGSWQVEINSSGLLRFWGSGPTPLFTGTTSVATGAWEHVSINRFRNTISVYRNGALEGASFSHSVDMITPVSKFSVGAQVAYRNAAYDLLGNIDDLIICRGIAIRTAPFGAPGAAFGQGPEVTAVYGASASPLRQPGSAAGRSLAAPWARRLRDLERDGLGKVVGTTKNVGTPNYPVSRRVRLLRKRDGLLAREVWSDAAGNYRFENVQHDIEYVVMSHDHTGLYNAVVADTVTPELMP